MCLRVDVNLDVRLDCCDFAILRQNRISSLMIALRSVIARSSFRLRSGDHNDEPLLQTAS